MCRRITLILFALVAILTLGFGAIVYNVTRPQSAPPIPQITEGLPPEVAQQHARDTLERIEQQLREPQPAPPPTPTSPDAPAPSVPDPTRFEVKVTEQEANELLQNLPQVRQITEREQIRNLQVRFEENRLVAAAQVPLRKGLHVRVTAAGQLAVRNGRIVYETEQVRVGDFPAPKPVYQLLDQHLSAGMDRLNQQVAGRVEDIELQPDLLIVRGTRAP